MEAALAQDRDFHNAFVFTPRSSGICTFGDPAITGDTDQVLATHVQQALPQLSSVHCTGCLCMTFTTWEFHTWI